MASDSRTVNSSDTIVTDQRQAVDNGAIAVGGESVVTINQVPDEALELTGKVIETLAGVVQETNAQNDSELLRLGQDVVKFAIPAALLAFVLKG